MEAIRENPSIIQSEIAERVGKSVPTIKRAMKRLADAGLIKRIGGKLFGRLEIKKQQTLHTQNQRRGP